MRHSRLSWLLPVLFILAGCEPFEPWFDYAADDPKLQHIGRMDWSTPDGPTYDHSGVTIRFRCNCTGVDVAFEDHGAGGDAGTNWVNVIVDGKTAAKVKLEKGRKLLRGARNLPRGEHLIEIVKRTSPQSGAIHFLGVSVQGVLLDAPAWPEKKFEFIGDSITCGYGNEARILAPTYTEPNTGYTSKNEDASQAYGALVGRKFDAMVVTTCISGRGIYRNNDGSTDTPLPALYTRVYADKETPEWKPEWYTPDVIVINLGTADFNVFGEDGLPSAPDARAFKDAYAAFVRKLRGYYPKAKIVCAVGPMMNDSFPPEGTHWSLIKRYVSEMVTSVNNAGDTNVHYFAHAPITQDPYGEDWHPTAEAHAQMAEEMAGFLEPLGL